MFIYFSVGFEPLQQIKFPMINHQPKKNNFINYKREMIKYLRITLLDRLSDIKDRL